MNPFLALSTTVCCNAIYICNPLHSHRFESAKQVTMEYCGPNSTEDFVKWLLILQLREISKNLKAGSSNIPSFYQIVKTVADTLFCWIISAKRLTSG